MRVERARGLDLVYVQSTGHLYLADDQDARTLIGVGYAGAAGHVNRTESEGLVAKGPIPRGVWRLDPPLDFHARLGPVAIPLEPAEPKTALKRAGFFVHGDNNKANGTASSGCVIMARPVRDLIKLLYWNFAVRTLVVE